MNIANKNNIKNLHDIKETLQGETSECGLVCILMLLQSLGYKETLGSMRKNYKLSSQGLSLSDMCDILEDYNIEALPIKFEREYLNAIPLPAILHVGGNHFVLAAQSSGPIFHIYDPAMGEQFIHQNILASYTSGFALILGQNVQPKNQENQDPPKKNLNKNTPKLSAILLLAGAASFITPLFVGNTINSMLEKTSFAIYWKLGIAFWAAVTGAYMLTLISERFIIIKSSLNSEVKMKEVYYKFINNPVSYFKKRTVGDLVSRIVAFNRASLERVGLEYSLGNAILVCAVSLVVMTWLQPLLAVISITCIVVTGVVTKTYMIKQTFYKSEIEKNLADQQQFFSETINGIVSWKASSSLKKCFMQFTHYHAIFIKYWVAKKKLDVSQQSLYTYIGNIELLLMLGVALDAMLTNKLTFGGFYSFAFLRQIAFSSITTVYLSMLELKENEVVYKRAQDLHDDVEIGKTISSIKTINNISITGLCYGYFNQRKILDSVNLNIRRGQKISIMGPSGSGKSSLLLMLSGLDEPTSSTLNIDEKHINNWNFLEKYFYLQTPYDIIFKGSVIENISMYDDNPEIEKTNMLIDLLALNEKITSLPDGMNTFITDSTSTFSAGERQRLLVCRALYSSKQFVLFDEPTANLDDINAELVFKAIAACDKTCIVVTHDSSFNHYFDNNYLLESGRLTAL